MIGGFRMKRNNIGTRLGKIRHDPVNRFHHQMHVNRHSAAIGTLRMRAYRCAHHWTDGEIGHVMVIHYVEMNDIGTRVNHGTNLFAQTGKVSRKNRGSNTKAMGHSGYQRGKVSVILRDWQRFLRNPTCKRTRGSISI